jgi:hypothetical protein
VAIKILSSEIDEEQIEQYSTEMKTLVKSLLNKDPDSRPSARDILASDMFASKIV